MSEMGRAIEEIVVALYVLR